MRSWDEIEHGRQLTKKVPSTEKTVKVKQQLKPWKGKILDVKEWEKAGKPEMWVIQDNYKGWSLYQDIAYGTLALTTWGVRRIVVTKANDFVFNEDQTVIGLGPFYLGNKCRIFIQATKVMTDE